MGDRQCDHQVELGLYRREDEHDSCGIGFVADIKGKKSHSIIIRGLEVLERMEHRGAESADNTSGDGAGLLLQIPHSFYKSLVPALPAEGEYGTGLVFFPKDKGAQDTLSATFDTVARAAGLKIISWRDVPTDTKSVGEIARGSEPAIRQVFLTVEKKDPRTLELRLFLFRKKLEKAVLGLDGANDFYLPSLSSRTIVYKGMLMSSQLRPYFSDLRDERAESAVALVHSRFSTNTFPAWPLAQPFRMVAHNGEINTVKGNRFWMAARESLLSHPELGDDLREILPIIEPGRSDSASFDNVLELLVMAGRSLPQALMMMVPESWNDKNPIPDELKRFYEYQACGMEPWDGPASMVFCDGRYVGGTLDRNGLRPSRYTLTKDGLLVMGSETGVQDFKPEEIAKKGRLLPGKLLLVDLQEGRIIPDAEVKAAVCKKNDYTAWVKDGVKTLESLPSIDLPETDGLVASDTLEFMENAAGYSREDRDNLLAVMADSGQEPTSSMGTDTPVAVFSDRSQRVYNYFKQVFAQVTNPPIDSIREELVMTLTSFLGRRSNILVEKSDNCRLLKLINPVITPVELKRITSSKEKSLTSTTLDATFAADKTGDLEASIDRVIREAEKAIDGGSTIIVLSDRAGLNPAAGRCAIPALLVVGALHHALIRSGRRMLASIIIETVEPREIQHFVLLFGYGVDAVVPYGALSSINSLRGAKYHDAAKNYIKGIYKSIMKTMSKMGTSTLRSYRGAEVFEAVGLGDKVIGKCFAGTASRIGGVGFAELEAEALDRYRKAVSLHNAGEGPGHILSGDGQYRWRKNGEKHAWNPETIHLLQWSTREGDYKKFKEFTAKSDELNRAPHVIRGLLDFTGGSAIPLSEVESVDEIMKRFTTGAMSFGSISKEAHETIAIAMNSIHGRSNSGEGGEEPERFQVRPDGTWARSAIKQVASGRFGVTSNYLANATEIQIKIAQGAKPGEGGQLPGHKVDILIGKTRNSTPGVTLISPPPHHDIYSIEDLAELIFDLKNANPTARISVKLVSETGVGTVAAGVAKAHADNILISGYDGGTGASPQSSIRHAGLPWEIGLAETHQTLVLNGLRDRVRLQTDGQIKSGRDIVIAGLLGAEEFGFGTSTLIVLGCVMMRKCHENTCPMGVATQDPELRRRFIGKSQYLINFFRFLAEETREVMASLGFRTFNELVGHSEYLKQATSAHPKAGTVDLSRLLYKPTPVYGGVKAQYCTQSQVHKIDNVLDRTLIEKCLAALDRKVPATFELPVKNTDRAVGAMLSWEVSKRFSEAGLPENFVTVDFKGSAGQSFGAFLAKGITFRLAGDANDYLGKGLSGGRIVVAPPAGSSFKSEENIIVGNTLLYGATDGEAFIAGVAGERFGVRNSGATAVVEGTGDHCAEYMTGGNLVVLGKVGRNFAAGMSGGIAWVLDQTGDFDFYLNKGMIELSKIDNEEDETFVKELIRKHLFWTGSTYAQGLLDNWAETKTKFIKVLPVEYKRALQQMKLAELDRKLYDIREREDITVRA